MQPSNADPGLIVHTERKGRSLLRRPLYTADTGTLVLVTHDRRMLEAVSTTRRLEVADGQVTER